ncbi:MAG: lysophospholipid acyltransferase family protein [Candidatus Hydrogenedentes bacterium]|nr:lysophospholipid acyltransferase family protein [Candidatus Hydrogenedentota bacterium]
MQLGVADQDFWSRVHQDCYDPFRSDLLSVHLGAASDRPASMHGNYMQRTILETPGFASLARGVARLYMRITGWHLEGEPPSMPKCVITAAPHTSNWDFVYSLAVCWSANVNIYWMGKDTLFPWGFGWLMKWFGGIPVDRTRGHNVAKQALHAYRTSERLMIIIPPEGTRKKVDCWKRGFYLIAKSAGIPIVMGYLDYAKKAGGFSPAIWPSGNVEADLAKMQEFYDQITGRYPDLASPALPAKRELMPDDIEVRT